MLSQKDKRKKKKIIFCIQKDQSCKCRLYEIGKNLLFLEFAPMRIYVFHKLSFSFYDIFCQ